MGYICMKYSLFVFNSVLWLMGMAVIALGVVVRTDPKAASYIGSDKVDPEAFEYLYTWSYVYSGVGLFIMIVGFLGCCGALNENGCMLLTYFFCLVLVFGTLMGAGWSAVQGKWHFKDLLKLSLEIGVEQYDKTIDSKQFMDSIQKRFQCCGAGRGIDDYKEAVGAHHVQVPSCTAMTYSVPCHDVLYEYFIEHFAEAAVAAIAAAVVLFCLIVMSCSVYCAMERGAMENRHGAASDTDVYFANLEADTPAGKDTAATAAAVNTIPATSGEQ